MDSFNSLFDSIFGTSQDDFRLLKQSYGGTHPYSCNCLACYYNKVFTAFDKDFRLTMEMAGTKKSDIAVTLKGEVLNVKHTTRLGELKEYSVTVPRKYYDLDKLECAYEDGLLTVTVPLKKIKPEAPPEIPETQIKIK